MSPSQKLRAAVTARLTAAAEDIFELLERTIVEYEEELSQCVCKHKKRREEPDTAPELHASSDVQMPCVSPGLCLKQEIPEPQIKEIQEPQIKEEPEEPCINQEEPEEPCINQEEPEEPCINQEQLSLCIVEEDSLALMCSEPEADAEEDWRTSHTEADEAHNSTVQGSQPQSHANKGRPRSRKRPSDGPSACSDSDTEGPPQMRRRLDVEEENIRLRNENEKLKHMLISEIPDMIVELNTALKSRGAASWAGSELEVPRALHVAPAQPVIDPVEIFPGSQVFVDKLEWAVVQNASTASAFIRRLLTAVFPVEVLLDSNLRGTCRDSPFPRRQALDRTKVDTIYRATLEKWPDVAPAYIGSVINNKITEIRWKNKQRNPEPDAIMLFHR